MVYEDLPEYCLHCRHLGHEEYYCSIKKREEQENKKAAGETSHKKYNHPTSKHEGASGTHQEKILQGQNKD